MFIFKSPTFVSQIQYLSRQLFPQNKDFLVDAYKKATNKPHSYLLVILHPTCSDQLRVRSGILPYEEEIICAIMNYIIEFEGFQLTSFFVFKEVSIIDLSSQKITHFFLKPPFSYKRLTSSEQKTVKYCETFLHKVKWFAGNSYMKDLYSFLSTIPSSSTIYTKGKQKVDLLYKILSRCNILDLEDFECPVITKISNIGNNQCPLPFHHNILNCSYIKVISFAKHLLKQQNEQTDTEKLFISP